MLTLVYIGLSVLGCGYIIVASFLGHLFDAAGDSAAETATDAGSAYGLDASGHGSVSAGGHAAPAFEFPFFSPLALATLFASLGGYGLIVRHGVGTSDVTSLAVAFPASLITAYAVTWAAWKVVRASRGSSQIRMADLLGAPAEVTTPIPAGGVGEILTIVRGQRFTTSARAEAGGDIARGAAVTIRRLVGSTAIVAPADGDSR